jgi:uncharacterized damage-inducible protein DinB
MDLDTRPIPPLEAGEKDLLVAWLDFHRSTLLMKDDGVTDEDLRRAMVPSGTSLLGLVKHLAYVERWWFRQVFAGEEVDFPWTDDDPDADWRIEPTDHTLRWIVTHMIEETARHNGHADIIRELIDGTTGR